MEHTTYTVHYHHPHPLHPHTKPRTPHPTPHASHPTPHTPDHESLTSSVNEIPVEPAAVGEAVGVEASNRRRRVPVSVSVLVLLPRLTSVTWSVSVTKLSSATNVSFTTLS